VITVLDYGISKSSAIFIDKECTAFLAKAYATISGEGFLNGPAAPVKIKSPFSFKNLVAKWAAIIFIILTINLPIKEEVTFILFNLVYYSKIISSFTLHMSNPPAAQIIESNLILFLAKV